MSDEEKLTEVLPMTRVSPALRARLDRIAANSVAPRVSDHIRYAVERYIEREEQNLNLSPLAQTSQQAEVAA